MLLLLLLLGVLGPWAEGKVFEPCELAKELKAKGATTEDIATWVCIAKHESNFNTSAVGSLNSDGSSDHGIFQISDRYWCSPQGWACNLPCSLLEDDDIADDWKCAKRVYKQHKVLNGNGFRAWAVYTSKCSGDNSVFVEGCFGEESEELEKTEGSLSAREGNNAAKVQVLDTETLEKTGKPSTDKERSPKGLWKRWTWNI